MKFPELTQTQKYICYTCLFLCISFGIWYGFGKAESKIVQCTSRVSKWVEANYSETTSSIDSEGNWTTDTDYWSEPASEVHTVVTIDGVVRQTDIPYHIHGTGVAIPSMYPAKDESMAKDYDFDNFSNRYNESYTVRFEDGDTVSESKSYNNMCIRYMENESAVTVKLWYGMKYGVVIK